MLSPSHSPSQPDHSLSRFMDSIFSYDSNVLLAALVSLLLVILFVLLLHVYARWFLAQAHHRRRGSSVAVSRVLGPTRFNNFSSFALDVASRSGSPTKGLDPAIVSEIPMFVFETREEKQGMECVICLSCFEDDDVGRNLPKCGHCFHLECIDMWFDSHSNCPICRAPVVAEAKISSSDLAAGDGNSTTATADEQEDSPEIVVNVSGSGVVENVGAGEPSPSPASSSSFGCSLKRMLSRNWSENKVFPASSVNDQLAA
ncbi:hypothetical protein UlMin_013135 [Ulmus minor]